MVPSSAVCQLYRPELLTAHSEQSVKTDWGTQAHSPALGNCTQAPQVVAGGGYSPAALHGSLTVEASLGVEYQLCSMRASAAVVCRLSSCVVSRLHSTSSIVEGQELVAPWHAESSQTRDQTCVSCTGRRILYH